jgi:MoxR-like ATPase
MDGIPAHVLKLARRLREQVLAPLQQAFLGKDEVVDVLGVCLVAGEHAFVLGPPGTAKSALVNELGQRLAGEVFSYLLTKFTEPSELFGPFDLRRLREGELVTNTAGMLPEAALVFLDELLNANSAILNSLLTVLNERVFRRGRESRRLPLLMVVGASNQLPEDDALGALFDRFLLRVVCDNVPADRLGEVLHAGWRLEQRRDAASAMPIDDVRQLQQAVLQIRLEPVHENLLALVQRLRQAGLPVSDRRAVKLQRVVAASALLCGRAVAERSDLWVCRHIWETLEQREVVIGLVDDAIGPVPAEAQAHPAVRRGGLPDGELLARELAQLASERQQGIDAASEARWQDRLRALAGRCEWVADATARQHLRQQIAGLWNEVPAP